MSELSVLPVADPPAELPLAGEPPGRLSFVSWVIHLLAIFGPLLGLGAAAAFLWGHGFSWVDLGLLLGMYLLTGLSITVGFHRLFTHRSFETTAGVKFLLGMFGSMTLQGSLLHWVALHRRHHQFSDRPGDPHSPHLHKGGVLGVLHGLWHAHIGWMFKPDPPDLDHYVKDLQKSRLIRTVSVLFLVWFALGLAIPAVLGGILTRSWAGAWSGLIWGGIVRVFVVQHVTWSINSICHLWGFRPYRSDDESRDNVLFGVIGMGEGWHHTHHTFPTSARHGLRWWQFDLSYWVIRGLAVFGLAWDIKIPTGAEQARERRHNPTTTPGGLSPA